MPASRHAIRRAICIIAATAAAQTASAQETLIAERSGVISYSDFSGFEVTSINTLFSIWENPSGGLSNIFNEVFIAQSVAAADAPITLSVDLTAPGQAAQVARLTNGTDDDIWVGADSFAGSDYQPVRESVMFAAATDGLGAPLFRADLNGLRPTRAELTIDSLSLEFDGFFETIVYADVTYRFYAQTFPHATFDVSDAEIWDTQGDPDNDVRDLDLAAAIGLPSGTPLTLYGYTYDLYLTTLGGSSAAGAAFYIDANQNGFWERGLGFSASDFYPATNRQFSSYAFCYYGISNPIGVGTPNGIVTLEFADDADTFPNAIDAVFEAGSTITLTAIPPCNPADIGFPQGTIDLSDINRFVGSFVNGVAAADIAEPFGVFDLSDITLFVDSFTDGCP